MKPLIIIVIIMLGFVIGVAIAVSIAMHWLDKVFGEEDEGK